LRRWGRGPAGKARSPSLRGSRPCWNGISTEVVWKLKNYNYSERSRSPLARTGYGRRNRCRRESFRGRPTFHTRNARHASHLMGIACEGFKEEEKKTSGPGTTLGKERRGPNADLVLLSCQAGRRMFQERVPVSDNRSSDRRDNLGRMTPGTTPPTVTHILIWHLLRGQTTKREKKESEKVSSQA